MFISPYVHKAGPLTKAADELERQLEIIRHQSMSPGDLHAAKEIALQRLKGLIDLSNKLMLDIQQ